MSIFKFERSALRNLGLSFLGSETLDPGKPVRTVDGPEDQNDPYLSQAARLLTGVRTSPLRPNDPNEAY